MPPAEHQTPALLVIQTMHKALFNIATDRDQLLDQIRVQAQHHHNILQRRHALVRNLGVQIIHKWLDLGLKPQPFDEPVLPDDQFLAGNLDFAVGI